LKIYRK